MDERQLNQYCLDWVHWCYTRRYYIAPGGKSVLAMALHTLADMKENHDAMVCFNLYYVEQADNVQRLADQLGISRPTYYNRVKAYARKALELSQSLKRAHEAAQPGAAPALSSV